MTGLFNVTLEDDFMCSEELYFQAEHWDGLQAGMCLSWDCSHYREWEVTAIGSRL